MMNTTPVIDKLMERSFFYNVFHGIVSGSKSEELGRYLNQLPVSRPLKVLDLGCGPGTNANLFTDRKRFDYLGVDFNPLYIEKASRKTDLNFKCADITSEDFDRSVPYDVILINSVFHHLNDSEADRVLEAAKGLLGPQGRCLVMDMVYPPRRTFWSWLQNTLISLDRGKNCREEKHLSELLSRVFKLNELRSFRLILLGVPLWEMRFFILSNPLNSSCE